MSIALLAAPGFFAPLQGLWRWFKPVSTPGKATRSRLARWGHQAAIHSVPDNHRLSTVQHHPISNTATRRPLRVLRVMEAGQPSAHVGRMVISGRMADVCAELDRLAACEVLLH